MIKVLDETENDLIAVKATGKLEKEDYNAVEALLDKSLQKYDKVRMYVDITEWETMEPQALIKDLQVSTKHATDMKKIAVVGERNWIETMTDLTKNLIPAEVKYFGPEEEARAKEWIK